MTRKITPEAFNEAAWNLGMPFRWNDLNHNGAREDNEVSTLTTHPFADVFFADGTKEKALQIIEEAATGNHLKVIRTPKYIQSLDKKVAGLQSGSTPELLRQALRDRDMAYRSWTKHTIDFSKLSEGEQKAAWIFLQEVVPGVEAAHAIELDPNNLKYFGEIAAQGSTADYLHAWYSGGPWCQEVKDEMCTSHPEGVPARVPNAGLWPTTTTQDDVAKLEAQQEVEPNKTLLSDFVIRYLENDQLKWRSINADPALQKPLQAISAGLRKMAAVDGLEPTTKNFLEIRAQEFENTDSPFPFFDGDAAWIAAKGGFDVTLGFYEEDDSPFGHTALMQSFIGPVDQERETLGHKFQGLVGGMEDGIAEFLGAGYKKRDFSKGLPPLRFANLIASGDGRVHYVPMGYYLPNVSPSNSSASKKVFALDHTVGRFEGVLHPMADIVIHPSQRIVSEKDVILFTIGHENAHGVGTLPQKTKALGQYSGAIEEAKADLEGIASLPTAVQNGIVTQAEADRACIALLYCYLRALSYGMSDPHGTGAIIEFTSLYKEGAIVEKEGYFAVNLQNGAFYKAAQKIARRKEKIQFDSTQDGDRAKTELAAWLESSKKEMPPLMKDKFLPILEKMPRDIFPWYSFKFSPAVEREMLAGGGQFSKQAAR